MPIRNTRNTYSWGNMLATCDSYCMTPTTTTTTGPMWRFTVSMVMNAGCKTMMYSNTSSNFYHVHEVLNRPIGQCTTNVLGSSVKFTCEGNYINEHVYID